MKFCENRKCPHHIDVSENTSYLRVMTPPDDLVELSSRTDPIPKIMQVNTRTVERKPCVFDNVYLWFCVECINKIKTCNF